MFQKHHFCTQKTTIDLLIQMESSLNKISISKLSDLDIAGVESYNDELIITDQIDHLLLFREPCRVDGIVLFVCLEGHVVCDINLKRYVLKPGDMIVNFNSNIIHKAECRGLQGHGVAYLE